ncbi:hypothetical protein R3P38DRAFT_2942570 [Favolaschia claudopus]|uniref:Protein kinase domain-containing protein n=1 Tax=Favolaschia claudopus TaxID=2862362 RepID=A0AAW0BK96_9AGAR
MDSSCIRKPGNNCPPSVLNSILRTKRTAEGCAWGHSLDSFFCARPDADSENYAWTDVWTTSVFEELGVIDPSSSAEPCMRRRKPWPVLKIPRGPDDILSLNDIDPSSYSEHNDSEDDLTAPAFGEIPVEVIDSLKTFEQLPKLEESVPAQYLPRLLCVHDPDARVSGTESSDNLIHYRRIYPEPVSSHEHLQDAGHLRLTRQSRIGCGHHSNVYHAALSLATSATQHLRVVAKVAVPRVQAREFLHHEAAIYDSFAEHVSQEFSGYALVPGIRYPVPVAAVAPKFFGYYVLDREDYEFCNTAEPSPILLLEECGEPIDPQTLSHDDKAECFSLFLRLHLSGIVQKSAFKNNILVQPGPLTAPPHRRSLNSPSFRVIDFGRSLRRTDRNQKEWLDERDSEVKDAQKVLRIPRHSMS